MEAPQGSDDAQHRWKAPEGEPLAFLAEAPRPKTAGMSGTSAYRRRRGVAGLLFERLAGPARLQEAEGLEASLRREIEDLFNTRAPPPIEQVEARGMRSAIDYGIPDLSAFPSGEHAAMTRLARHLREALLAFEPRLEAPVVRIRPDGGVAGALVAVIEGSVRLDARVVPVRFEMPLPGDAVIRDAA